MPRRRKIKPEEEVDSLSMLEETPLPKESPVPDAPEEVKAEAEETAPEAPAPETETGAEQSEPKKKRKRAKKKKEDAPIEEGDSFSMLPEENPLPDEAPAAEAEESSASSNEGTESTEETASENSPAEPEEVAEETTVVLLDAPILRVLDKKTLKEKKKAKENRLFSIVFALSILVFLVSLVIIGINLYGKYQASKMYNPDDVAPIISVKTGGGLSVLSQSTSVSEIYDLTTITNQGTQPQNPQPVDVQTVTAQQLEAARMSSYIRSLQAQNEDILGYIYIENTKISYPVVQGTDNVFYLNHDPFSKGYLIVGSVILDHHNNRDLSKNYNTLIYGHNLDNGGMFHDVTKFRDPTFFNETLIYVYTTNGLYIYKPFCFYMNRQVDGYAKYSFYNKKNLAEWCTARQAMSEIPSDHVFTNNESILTLATCLNSTTTSQYRYVLHAYLVEYVK